MARDTNSLIEELAADLHPVRSISFRDGLILTALAMLFTIGGVTLFPGLWYGAWRGEASSFFVITNGLLLVLGCASTNSVLRMASPQVGNSHDGPCWCLAMVALLPIAALAGLPGLEHAHAAISDAYGPECFFSALAAAALMAVTLLFWLRRGAPVSPSTAGLHMGIASTALGASAYGLACPLDDAVHLGVWHVAPVAAGALIGRLIVPRFLRW